MGRDWKKMSKCPKNYSDTDLVINQYRVDVLHMYLTKYPVLRVYELKP